MPTCFPPFGADVYDMIGTLDYLHIMLDNQYGVTSPDQCVECLKECFNVMKMKSRGGLVEDKESGLCLLLSQVVGKFHPLVLPS